MEEFPPEKKNTRLIWLIVLAWVAVLGLCAVCIAGGLAVQRSLLPNGSLTRTALVGYFGTPVTQSPGTLSPVWAARSYHGSVEHNARAVINRWLGYWDGNPATLMPLSPRDSAPLYVEMMGGSAKVIAKGKQLHGQGKYFEAVEILNKLVFAEPGNTAAKDLLADVYEQIGYQKESPSVRNSFLGAAYELRHGMPSGAGAKSSGPDTIRGMSTELWLNFLGISLDSRKVAGQKFSINLVTPDNGEKFLVELGNSVLTNIKGRQAKKPDLTITLNRSDLEKVIYYQDYVVVDAGDTELKYKQMLTEDEYRESVDKFGNAFKALMGADAIRELIAKLDLIGIAQIAPLIPPMIAPTTPMIAQYGENAPAVSLGNNTNHPSGNFSFTTSRTLIRSDKPERM